MKMLLSLIRIIFRLIIRGLRWCWRYGIVITLFSLFIIAFIPSSTIHFEDVYEEIAFVTVPYHFDFVTWEIGAIAAKAESVLFGQAAYMSETDRSDIVREYMADLAQLQALEAQISRIYNDPAITNPVNETQDLQSERDTIRDDLRHRQSTVESILEGQVAAVLVDEGFGTMGQLFPPMAMRFTGMPNLLVVSPRDAIRMENSLVIDPLPVNERANLEEFVMDAYAVSAIVVPLGGIALYPAMIQESSNLAFVIETFAHEWAHHYLYFHPLGMVFFTGDSFAGEGRIINETTSDLFGKEIATLVIERYYPELTPPQLPTYENSPVPIIEIDPHAFDFAAEMNETRVIVDEFLVNGQVEAAEAYMEDRRIFFYENGYSFRRLNQAFFAFYGGYQAGGGVAGAGGEDPIGPAIVSIRQNTASIYDFIQLMQVITSREELLNTEAGLLLRN